MAFSAIIAHRIQHDTPASTATIQLRNEEFPASGVLDELGYELKTNFIRRSGKQYGRFSTDTASSSFSSWLNEYRQQRLSLSSFTQKIVQSFKLELDGNDTLIDAHLFFIMEKIEAGEYLYLFAVEHMSGLEIDSNITISESRYIDTANILLGAKVNLSDWHTGDSNTYLSILSARGEKELSEAFNKLVGFSDKHDVKSDTVEFLKTVDNFSATLDDDTAKITRTKVVDYCLAQNKAGKAVVIQDLSSTLSEEIKSYEPERFARFVEASQPEARNEFVADANQLRSYARISGRNDSLSMSFASECLGKEILYDPSTDSLTIKNIPPALKARLLRHLQAT